MNLEALHAILDQHPDDRETRSVLADAMEEMGDEIGAEGQRWQVANKKHPAIGIHAWWFSGGVEFPGDTKEPSNLGDVICDGGTGRYRNGPHGKHDNRQDAERALAERLAELQISAYCHK